MVEKLKHSTREESLRCLIEDIWAEIVTNGSTKKSLDNIRDMCSVAIDNFALEDSKSDHANKK